MSAGPGEFARCFISLCEGWSEPRFGYIFPARCQLGLPLRAACHIFFIARVADHASDVLPRRQGRAHLHSQGAQKCQAKRRPIFKLRTLHLLTPGASRSLRSLLSAPSLHGKISQKETPEGKPTESAHPARFSPDDKFSKHRLICKRRFGLLPTQKQQTPL